MLERKRPRVLIADDYPPIVIALKRVLDRNCDVVGVVDDCRALLEATARLQPDVVLLDLHLQGGRSLQMCEELTRTADRTRVIVLTAGLDPALRAGALTAGASAFLDKTDAGAELLAAIAKAHEA